MNFFEEEPKKKRKKEGKKTEEKTRRRRLLLNYARPRRKHLTLSVALSWSRDRIVERTNPFDTFSDHKKRVGSEFRSKVDKELSR
jgi:hypothetical protein